MFYSPLVVSLQCAIRAVSLIPDKYKAVTNSLCCPGLILTDSSLLLICLLNVRCKKLCRPLWSLLAHAMEVTCLASDAFHQPPSDSLPSDCEYKGRPSVLNERPLKIYDNHLVWILFRELRDTGKLIENFLVQCLGFNFNYGFMLKAHFWLGIFFISMACDLSLSREGLVVGLL